MARQFSKAFSSTNSKSEFPSASAANVTLLRLEHSIKACFLTYLTEAGITMLVNALPAKQFVGISVS